MLKNDGMGLPLAVFLIALVPRLAVALWLPADVVWPDGHRYERVALNLLHGEGFGTLSENRASFPTLPILIAATYSIFGENREALRLVFAVLGAVTAVLGFAIAKRLAGSAVALVAGVLLGIYPYFVYLSALFEYPQGLFILLMGAFFICLLRFNDERRIWDLAIAGLFLGLGVLTVPTVLIYVPFALGCVVTKSFSETVMRLVVVVAAIGIPVGAWVAHNWIAYDRFVLVNASGGANFWSANNETYFHHGKKAVVPPCAAGYEESEYCIEVRELRQSLRDKSINEDQAIVQEESLSWKKGFDFIRASESRFAESVARKFGEYWSPLPNALHRDVEHGGSIRNLISIVSYVPVLVMGLLGAIVCLRHWRRFLPIYLYFLAFSAPYYLFLPTTRYRLPLDFFLIVFASISAVELWKHHRLSTVQPVSLGRQ